MNSSPNGFDRIAPIYDLLARIVFDKSIEQSQKHFLGSIPPYSQVLILGGGTGALLTALLRAKPYCEIWYIDASHEMIERAKGRKAGVVHFIQGTQVDIPSLTFDVVITNFYLDLFPDVKLHDVVAAIMRVMRPGGKWLVTDFIPSRRIWHKMLLPLMYFFFRKVCKIESKRLPRWREILGGSGLFKETSQTFYDGFIESAVYGRK